MTDRSVPTISPEQREQLIGAMKSVFGEDRRRVDHSMKVLAFADQILRHERACSLVVVAAAVLHDIGIHQAEAKHGSAAGAYQEIEGPPIARRILTELDVEPQAVEHVCRIIANHHSARDIDTTEFRIVWDADWLVKFPEEFGKAERPERTRRIHKIFRTETGKKLAEKVLFSRGE